MSATQTVSKITPAIQGLADAIAANYAARQGKVPYLPKTAVVERKKYVLIDRFLTNNQQSGMFVVDPATNNVYNITAYGRPNRLIGTVETVTAEWIAETGK